MNSSRRGAGRRCFAEVMRSLKVREKIASHFPRPGSNRGYEAWEYVEPLLLMMDGGGRHVEDLGEIEEDGALRTLVGMRRMPSTSTAGDWLQRMGGGHVSPKSDSADSLPRQSIIGHFHASPLRQNKSYRQFWED